MDTTTALLSFASRYTTGTPATLGLGAPMEEPLPEPEGEWVFRTGHGWVQRPVEVEQPQEADERERAAA